MREFLWLTTHQKVHYHRQVSRKRSRLQYEVSDKIFDWVLTLVTDNDLVQAQRMGVDGASMEANTALRTIAARHWHCRKKHASGLEQRWLEMRKRHTKAPNIPVPVHFLT